MTEGPDEVIHQSTRLRLAAALNALGTREQMEFAQLRALLETTDGNLATHLAAMEKAAYVAITKDFVGKKPRTRVALTRRGREALRRHVAYLRAVLDGVD